MPPSYTNKELADRFNNYFIDKIIKISTDLIGKCQHPPPYVEIPAPQVIQKFSRFQSITLSKHEKIIPSSPSKDCELDPIPNSLLKQILPSIVGIIADIINTSLRDGVFPESLRKALVKPLLMKANLDLLDGNYSPVSNLGYVTKLMEWAAAAQLVNHIESHGLMEVYQSAYCAFHSTEPALLKVKTNVIKALENQEVACLILLDLSVAFDTIDHNILLHRLETRFTVPGATINWFRSYLTDRAQAIVIGDLLSGRSKSATISLNSRIPQGSVLGPILFTIYMVPIGDIYRKNEIEFHLYTDDTPTYISFKPSVPNSKSDCIAGIEKCIEEINIWMTQNLLKLNSDKTEFIPLGTRQQLSKVGDISLHICGDTVIPLDHVRKSRLHHGQSVENGPHINKITSSCCCKLHELLK